MKITADLDCTPQELRAFLGLPDLAPMQKAVMDQMERRLIESMEQLSPATMMREWFSPSGAMQQTLMNMFQAGRTQTSGGSQQAKDHGSKP